MFGGTKAFLQASYTEVLPASFWNNTSRDGSRFRKMKGPKSK
uniref:Uncharacterized protein n=1 Tax=Solanum lycopersicum TaxID=4081 RepID=A0A3Q7IVT2_SOLLC